MPGKEKLNIFWFRRDLRLFDNRGLLNALQGEHPVLPLFIFDQNILSDLKNKTDARVQFIHDQVTRISHELSENNSGILVRFGRPVEVFKALIDEYSINAVFSNEDYEPYGKSRDEQIKQLLLKSGISFFSFQDHVIFHPDEILSDKEQPLKVFTPYKNRWLRRFEQSPSTPLLYDLDENKLFQGKFPPVPELNKIGFKRSDIQIPAGNIDIGVVSNYHNTRNIPSIPGTSRIGIHLRHGTISIRQAVSIAAEHNQTWLNELIWREFYMMILAHHPSVVSDAFKSNYDLVPWRNDPNEFEAWCKGHTGYPIVDAGMRELNTTGYMHNRVRMITASFLTKHLLVDWRWGEAYFASKLLDYELSSNNGGWQWAAGTGTDAQPYFRVFNPYLQAEKFDPENAYIRKWVPEFSTDTYTAPIVDHKFARERAIETYKKAVS
jgi:deoxyribodipyrimidine photo-lyase